MPARFLSPMFYSLLMLAMFGLASAQAACSSLLYCQGPLLDTILSSPIVNNGSKTFINRPAKENPEIIYDQFMQLNLQNPTTKDAILQEFIDTYFAPEDSDLIDVVPDDWTPNPAFLSGISDPNLRLFGADVHNIWKNLSKFFVHDSNCTECYSSIAVPFPFMVAGGMFTEYYYWDSFWIIQGLLVSGMNETAKGMIINYLYLVDTLGFIPNGGRVYFKNRSQPPMLTQMVKYYVDATGDYEFMEDTLPYLLAEYEFWMTNRTVKVPVNGSTYQLNLYNVDNTLPRPEAYMSDINGSKGMTGVQKAFYYGQVATACESGMDFSSKWFTDKYDFRTINTKEVIPVELNAIMLANEKALSHMFGQVVNVTEMEFFTLAAADREAVMTAVFWNDAQQIWNDYLLWNNSLDEDFYITNYLPVWAGLWTNSAQELISDMLDNEAFQYPAGVPTSLINSTQQWDFPNAWAPHMWFLIEGLESLNDENASGLAVKLAQNWIGTNYCGWETAGEMFEKFDVLHLGEEGKGGQYPPQAGFGWTNGVVLHLLNKYGDQLIAPNCTEMFF